MVRKILFVCSGNIDRSPTAEQLFKNYKGLEVKSAGTDRKAPNPISADLIQWADKIFAMEEKHKRQILRICPEASEKIIVLNIEDLYEKNDPQLITILKTKVTPHLKNENILK
jgi:predicted protein tyrosine phosphatase